MRLAPFKFIYIIILANILAIVSCSSVSYLDKNNFQGSLKQLTESTYHVSKNDTTILKKGIYSFTKGGRIENSVIYNESHQELMVTEKKTWFVKQSFPDKEPYYCKTRWKPNERERISCYTQKQYKQNEAIYYYHKDGRIDKIEDNFTTFNKKYYHYNASKELTSVTIKNKQGQVLDSIVLTCYSKDSFNNCTKLAMQFTKSDSLLVLKREFIYATQ